MTRPLGNSAEPGTQAPSDPLETQSGLLPPLLPPCSVSFPPAAPLPAPSQSTILRATLNEGWVSWLDARMGAFDSRL